MNSKIAELMPFVDFLGAALGSATEVVLHDLTEPGNSVVKIVNGHVSGRNVGAPATDFARAIVREYGDSSNINFADRLRRQDRRWPPAPGFLVLHPRRGQGRGDDLRGH